MEKHDRVAIAPGVDVRDFTIEDGYALALICIKCGDIGLGQWVLLKILWVSVLHDVRWIYSMGMKSEFVDIASTEWDSIDQGRRTFQLTTNALLPKRMMQPKPTKRCTRCAGNAAYVHAIGALRRRPRAGKDRCTA